MHHVDLRLRNELLPWAIMAFGAVVVGGAIALGSTTGTVVVACVCGAALAATFMYLSFPALLLWAPASVLLYPFLRYPRSGSLVTFDRIWLAALAAALLVTIGRTHAPATRRLAIALLLLVVVFGARAFTSGIDTLSAGALWVDAIILPAILFFVVRELVTTHRRAEQLIGSLTAAGVLLALIGIAEHVVGFDLASRSGGSTRFDTAIASVRISGPYSAPEPYALSLLTCLAATFAWIQIRKQRIVIAAPLLAMQLTALYLTYFRAVWIGVVIVAVASLGLRPRRFGRALVVATATAAVLFVAADQLRENRAFATRTSDTTNIKGRLATYEEALDIFHQNPVFGVGIQKYEEAQQRVHRVVDGVSAVSSPHSSFLSVLTEQGIAGFIPVAAITVAIALLVRRYRQRTSHRVDVVFAASLAGGAVAFLLMSATLTMITYGPSNSFFAVALGIAAGRLSSDPDEQ